MSIATTGAGRSKGQNAAITYLLRDEFTTDEAAPLTSPRTCEPGPGTFVVDNARPYISGGELVFPDHATINTSYLTSGALDHAAGRAFIYSCRHTNIRVDPGWVIGGVTYGLYSNGTIVPTVSGYGGYVYNASLGTLCAIRSESGFFYYVDATTSELIWVNPTTTLNAAAARVGTPLAAYRGIYDFARVVDLAAPWTTDYGIATQRLAGARSAGDTFTHEGNALIEFTVGTVPVADQIELRFRIQDATNYWQVTVDSTGALDLDEVVAGVVTQRGTSAGVIANGDRIVIVCVGTTIRVIEANAQHINYAAAVNFATETDGELETEGTGGAVTDIIAWPRTISGAALTELEKYTT